MRYRAKPKDGALVGVDHSYSKWPNVKYADKADWFEARPNQNRRGEWFLHAPYFGEDPYGNGGLWCRESDLVFESEVT